VLFVAVDGSTAGFLGLATVEQQAIG
jgi:hypothetical protein